MSTSRSEATPEILRREIALVTMFADLRVLFRSRHREGEGDFPVRSPQEHFFAYLRSLDADREGLPARFVADLRRALAHFQVKSLEPDPKLQDALYWIFQSQQRLATHLPVVVAVLERWLYADQPLTWGSHDDGDASHARDEFQIARQAHQCQGIVINALTDDIPDRHRVSLCPCLGGRRQERWHVLPLMARCNT